MPRPRLLVFPLAAVLAAGASGCAGQPAAKDSSAKNFSGVQAQVATAIEDLQDAGAKRDQNKICTTLLAKELVAKIAASGQSCPDVLKKNLADADTFEMDVKKVTVDGNAATAVVLSDGGADGTDQTDTFSLVKESGGWRISSFG